MAGAFKRASDKARGPVGKWTGWYVDRHGKQIRFAGTTDKATTLIMAQNREREEMLIRDGMMNPAEVARREQAARPLADHLAEFRDALVARGNTEKYANGSYKRLLKLLTDASITTIADLSADRLGVALGRLKRAGASAATVNAGITVIKMFANWLDEMDRIEAVPKGIRGLRKLDAANDRRYQRREPKADEWQKLLEVAEASGRSYERREGSRHGPVIAVLNGPDRAMLYRVAAVTGFRVSELRSLTKASFRLDSHNPHIVLEGASAKNRKAVQQPIPREMAATLKPWVETLPDDRPAWFIPHRSAEMLHNDCKDAGINPKDSTGRVLDFHSLRSYYINDLRRRGVDPKQLQTLARHSTPVLTFNTYMHADDEDLRRAIEKGRIDRKDDDKHE